MKITRRQFADMVLECVESLLDEGGAGSPIPKNLPPTAVTIRRTLTEKSKLGFGKYPDLTVGDILAINPEYIVWAYACIPNIGFADDILDGLGISRRIEKPGTDVSVLREWRRSEAENSTPEERALRWIKIWSSRRKAARERLAGAERRETLSPARLQAINHGHVRDDGMG